MGGSNGQENYILGSLFFFKNQLLLRSSHWTWLQDYMWLSTGWPLLVRERLNSWISNKIYLREKESKRDFAFFGTSAVIILSRPRIFRFTAVEKYTEVHQ